jgi:3-deoxy-D-manno-octulosonic-acid transferase
VQFAYDLLYVVTLVVGLPFFLVKIATSRRWRSGLAQRLGAVPAREGSRPCIWVHGVSVGEVLAARTLVAAMRETMPGWDVVISTTTSSGQEVARRSFPGYHLFYYPIDFSFITRRVLDRIRPDVVVLLELEIWPNFLLSTSRRGIPVFLVNGRITQRSVRGYRWLQRVIPEPLDRIRLYAVQAQAYRDRFLAIGIPPGRVFVTGNMKFDTVVTEGVEALRESSSRTLGLSGGEWILIAGSTHDGEDEMVLAAFRAVADRDPEARLVIAPRHLERLASVEAAVREAGFRPLRRTRIGSDRPEPGSGGPGRSVLVLDTMGELSSLYAVADVVFVGGSLVPHGGQNLLEPAGYGKPVLTGPHNWNFEEIVEVLAAAGGLEIVKDAKGLEEAVLRLHADRGAAARIGEAARGAVLRGKGATRRTLDLLRERLDARAAGAGAVA